MMMTSFVRASALTGYADCPRRAAAGLFREEIQAAGFDLNHTPQGAGAAVGTAVHAGASLILDEKMASGTMPPLSVATDAAIESLRETIRSAESVSWDGKSGATRTLDEGETQVVRMTRVYRDEIAPLVNPLQVEERLEAEVVPGLVLTGQADVIAREPGTVRDLKTGTKQKPHGPQVGAYSLLARSCRDTDTTAAVIDFIPRVSAKKEQPPAVTVKVPLASAETAAVMVLAHIERDIATFRDGDPLRRILPGDPWSFVANPSSMLCNPKYCPAFGTAFCREHAGIEED